MNLNKANLAIKVAIERANVIGAKFCIAIMDAGVNLVAFSRMDGGRVGTIDVAMKKVSRQLKGGRTWLKHLAQNWSLPKYSLNKHNESYYELFRFSKNIQPQK